MNRRAIVGYFGASDKVTLKKVPNEIITKLDFLNDEDKLKYGISESIDMLHANGVFPSEIGVDLLILAELVYAADTRISRGIDAQDSWTREIRLIVPVSNSTIWLPAVPVLTRMLNFLTGDRWTVEFRGRPKKTFNASRPAGNPTFDCLSLFSGGLDSLIGAIDLLESGHKPLLISHAGEGVISSVQEELFEELKAAYPENPFLRLRLWLNFPKKLISDSGQEDTTRGRSFLFFALGAFAGSGLGQSFVLNAPENGLIALNVPLDPLRLGSLSTRTTHPFYISRWNELMNIIGIKGEILNPYWNRTKGEMMAKCRNRLLLKKLAPRSVSCSSIAKSRWAGVPNQHCGFCLPCLIRRAAFLTGFPKGNDKTQYTLKKLSNQTLNPKKAMGNQIRSFQYAMESMKKNPAASKLMIFKAGPLADVPAQISQLEGVYVRGMKEVAKLIGKVKTIPK